MTITHVIVSGLAMVAMLVPPQTRSSPMHLGNFSISLSVSDVHASKQFYEKLGFVQRLGNAGQGWAIMRSGTTNIGLFQGGFKRNMLTFNPGWDQDGQPNGKFEDVRAIQQQLKSAGIEAGAPIEGTAGPASFTITDPDGNPILFDQHL